MNCYEAAEILERGTDARELLREAQLVLQEMPVKNVNASYIAAELVPMIRGWCQERGYVGPVDEVMLGVAKVVDRELTRIGDVATKEYCQALSLWLRGYEGKLLREAIERDRWALVRRGIREYLSSVRVEDLSVLPSDGSLVDELRPLVKELKKKSLEAVRGGELTGDKTLAAFRDVVRLYGTASGELSQKVDMEIGPNETFKAIMGMKQVDVIPGSYELLE